MWIIAYVKKIKFYLILNDYQGDLGPKIVILWSKTGLNITYGENWLLNCVVVSAKKNEIRLVLGGFGTKNWIRLEITSENDLSLFHVYPFPAKLKFI